jgi:hypothetical protein
LFVSFWNDLNEFHGMDLKSAVVAILYVLFSFGNHHIFCF